MNKNSHNNKYIHLFCKYHHLTLLIIIYFCTQKNQTSNKHFIYFV